MKHKLIDANNIAIDENGRVWLSDEDLETLAQASGAQITAGGANSGDCTDTPNGECVNDGTCVNTSNTLACVNGGSCDESWNWQHCV